jgi:hypothetical protein
VNYEKKDALIENNKELAKSCARHQRLDRPDKELILKLR